MRLPILLILACVAANSTNASAQTPAAPPAPIPIPAAGVTAAPAPDAPAKGAATTAPAKSPAEAAKAATPIPTPVPAKQLFGTAKTPTKLAARAIGSYAKGCLAGGRAISIDGAAWQVMRLSRNRNWGHPELIKTVERLAIDAQKLDGWPGLLVGDLAQPRGGPMLTGHASHQIGLDADIWLTPMPPRRLSEKEREELSATSMVAEDKVSISAAWTPGHVQLIKRAASYPNVERILVNPVIKKALCDATEKDPSRAWLAKVRPYWGHEYHMHIRIPCPASSAGCTPQQPVGPEDGCGKEVADWLKLVSRPPAPPPDKPTPPKPPLTLDQLPPECRMVLAGVPQIPRPLVKTRKAAEDKVQPAGAKK